AFWPVIRPLVKFLIGFFGDTLRFAIGGIKDVIVGLIKVFSGLLEFITGVFTNDWGMALGGLKKIFFGVLRAIVGLVKLVFVFGVGAAFRGAWKLISFIFTRGAGGIRKIFGKLLGGVRNLAFRGMELASGIFRGAIGKITGFFTGLKDKVLAGMGKLRDGLKIIFEKIRKYVGNPIISVIDFVINRGLIGGINKLAGYAGLKGKDGKGVIGKVPLPKKYAKGGIHGVRPGYTPGRDNQVIAVGGGEAIMRPEWTRGVGAGFVNQMNLIARRGGASAVRAAMGGARAFANGGIVWPTNTKALSGDYPGHTGVDIRAAMGAPIFAAQAGRVIAANRWNRSYGYHARIRGTDGIESVYAHMSRLIAKVGQMVSPGTRIGNVGSTGNSSGPHLHFEVRPGGTRATALSYLNNGKIPEGGGIIDKLAGLGKGAISALKNPLNYFNKRLSGAFSRIGGLDGFAGKLMKGIPKKLVGGLVSKIKSLAFKGLGVGKDFFVGAGKKVLSAGRAVAGLIPGVGGKGPKLYDNGGMLPTGLSLVMNKTSRPEPVLTGEQWDRMKQGGARGDIYNITGNGADPEVLAKQLVDKLRFEQRRARRSGTLAGKVA
ncbi:MAG: peptidoglycan DD-metalloendopeptidase family protein, partial [Candidatus Saccharibacteria bacterium]|nr:peptidoglycan DD-metalloendopeptidase family protein [Microbacteriaceae bacterium]